MFGTLPGSIPKSILNALVCIGAEGTGACPVFCQCFNYSHVAYLFKIINIIVFNVKASCDLKNKGFIFLLSVGTRGSLNKLVHTLRPPVKVHLGL